MTARQVIQSRIEDLRQILLAHDGTPAYAALAAQADAEYSMLTALEAALARLDPTTR